MSVASYLSKHLRTVSDWLVSLEHSDGGDSKDAAESLDEYVVKHPAHANAIQILPGWNHKFADDYDGSYDPGGLFHDPRILWAFEQFGSLEQASVLELGPLEASHTYMLEKAGAREILAIEANKLSFLRCLIVKEILNLQRSRFLLGDFQAWLERNERRYDFIVASGVLYHMQHPLCLLKAIAAHTDAFYLWTHYVSDEAMPADDFRRQAFLAGKEERVQFHGTEVRLYPRSYHGAWRAKSFCGGTHDKHRWIQRDDLINAIRALGFDDIRVTHDQWNAANGPSFSIFARRSVSAC